MTEYLMQTQRSEDTALAPVLLETIPFGTFTANATITKQYLSKLNRNAKRRAILFKNTLNQAVSTVKFYPYDSCGGSWSSLGGDTGTPGNGTISATSGLNAYSSTTNPILGSPTDSMVVSVLVGATAPTSGNLQIWLIEVV